KVVCNTYNVIGTAARAAPGYRAAGPGDAIASTDCRDGPWRSSHFARTKRRDGASRTAGDDMADRPPKVLICSCEDTMPLDVPAVQRGCRGAEVSPPRPLCRPQLHNFPPLAAR